MRSRSVFPRIKLWTGCRNVAPYLPLVHQARGRNRMEGEWLCHSRDNSTDRLRIIGQSHFPIISANVLQSATFQDQEVVLSCECQHFFSSFYGGCHSRRVATIRNSIQTLRFLFPAGPVLQNRSERLRRDTMRVRFHFYLFTMQCMEHR